MQVTITLNSLADVELLDSRMASLKMLMRPSNIAKYAVATLQRQEQIASDAVGLKDVRPLAALSDNEAELLASHIRNLSLPRRVVNSLLYCSVDTVGKLTEKSETELLKMPNLGVTGLMHINQRLKSVGLKLRES